MKRFWLTVVGLVVGAAAWCQPQNRNWYFGYNAGIHWDAAGNPTAVTDGILTSRNNATAISDANGDLVFYSDGHRVYNKFHQQILHGDSLFTSRIINASGYHGSISSGGSVLLRSLEDTSEYVMFSCNALNTMVSGFIPGLLYNRISVSGDSVVLPKNQMVYTATDFNDFISERILAIKHANGRDWWLVTHRVNSDEYWIWLYDPAGIQGPFSNQIGQYIGTAGYRGWLSSNKEGNKIVSVANGGYAEVLDFDRCTGQLSNWVDLGFPPYPNLGAHIYSGDFSPNQNVLYLVGEELIYQYDLTAANPKSTETLIYTNPYFNNSLPVDSQLQLGHVRIGLDNQIYIALSPDGSIDNQPSTYQFNPRTKYLAVIHDPDVLGSGCNFQLNGFYLGGKYSTYAMPNTAYHLGPLIGSGCDTLVPPTALFNTQQTDVCPNGCVTFTNQTQSVGNAVSFQWLFPGGTPGQSNAAAPTVCYPSPGTYPVTLVATNPFGSDTVEMPSYITVHALPVVSISPLPDSLQTPPGFVLYQWSLNGNALVETTSTIAVQGSGTYAVTVTDTNGCSTQSTFTVTAVPNHQGTAAPSLTLHPNPAHNQVVCRWHHTRLASLAVYNVLGQTVMQQPVNNTTEAVSTSSTQAGLDISALPAGVYTVRGVAEDGNALVEKLVVE